MVQVADPWEAWIQIGLASSAAGGPARIRVVDKLDLAVDGRNQRGAGFVDAVSGGSAEGGKEVRQGGVPFRVLDLFLGLSEAVDDPVVRAAYFGVGGQHMDAVSGHDHGPAAVVARYPESGSTLVSRPFGLGVGDQAYLVGDRADQPFARMAEFQQLAMGRVRGAVFGLGSFSHAVFVARFGWPVSALSLKRYGLAMICCRYVVDPLLRVIIWW
jgi:hypothetical protein